VSWLLRRHQLPIRLWLQSTSFAAVLAGYALLLAANGQLLQAQRQRQHLQRVAAIELRLRQVADAPTPLPQLLQQVSVADLQVLLVTACPLAAVRQPFTDARTLTTTSCRSLWFGGAPRQLMVVEDVSADLAEERTSTLLLTAAAGAAALLTSGLMRLVLREGLKPLAAMGEAIDAITAADLADQRLPLADQPPELQPIAQAFNALLERLSQSWEHQRTFVNAVAHELRTPITLVGVYANRLRRQAATLAEPQQQALGLIHEEATRMGSLVTDLLEIARDDAGRLEVKRELLDAGAVLREVHQRLAPSLGPRLQLGAGAAAPQAALGDAARLQQCLTNLIENAVKYTPEGTAITLLASQQGGRVVLHVRDQGSGVPEADRSRIFERFVRGRSELTAARPGSGLGLAVVHTLMQRMGGTALVADAPNGGADFQLVLPAQVPSS